MQTRQRKGWSHHRSGIPSWILNKETFFGVVVRYLEAKAFGATKVKVNERCGLPERLRRAEAVLKSQRAAKIQILQSLSKRHFELKRTGDPEHKKLECQLQNLDTQIRFLDRGHFALVSAVLYLSYRCGLDSVAVGLHLSMRPETVRQVCARCRRIAGTPAPKRNRLTAEERAKRQELKAARIKARAELREARRAERAAKKAEGRHCKTCGKPTMSATAWYCSDICKPTKKSHAVNTCKRRRAAGLCGSCGGERDDTAFKMCSACRERTRAATARCARKKKALLN
jgi:hypothetical protein